MQVFVMLVTKSQNGTVVERNAPRTFGTYQKAVDIANGEYPNLMCIRELNTQRRLFNAYTGNDELGYSTEVHVYATE